MQRRIWTAAPLVVGLVVAGCGGSSGSSNNSPPPGGVDGNITLGTQTGTSPTGGSSAPGTVTPATCTGASGGSITAGIPGGVTIPAGSPVLLIPNVLPIDVEPVNNGQIVHKATPGLLAAEIYLCGPNFATPVDTGIEVAAGGVMVAANGGQSYSYYALPYPGAGKSTAYYFEISGPIQAGNGAVGQTLNISDGLYYNFMLSNGGYLGAGLQDTYPSSSNYALPANGQSLVGSYLRFGANGASLQTTVPTTMTVNWPGRTITQTHTLSEDTITLFKNDNSNTDIVPTNGITNAYMWMPNTQ